MFVLGSNSSDFRFPPPELASREGLLAIGGDLRPERLLEAYRQGIFPWYSEGQPILWWSPDPRAVLFPADIRVSRSLRKTLRSGRFRVTFDENFRGVVTACAGPRPQYPEGGTWITGAMHEAYSVLHRRGHAHSVEIWHEQALVGGLYGVTLGGAFFGESMFSRETDASKVALVYLARQLERWNYALIDCQLPSDHLIRLGAKSLARRDFLDLLREALARKPRHIPWHFDSDLAIV